MNCAYGSGSCGPTVTTTTTVAPRIGTAVHTHVSSALPFTGGDVIGLLIIAVVCIGVGLALAFFRGRRNLEGVEYMPAFVSDPYHDVEFRVDDDEG